MWIEVLQYSNWQRALLAALLLFDSLLTRTSICCFVHFSYFKKPIGFCFFFFLLLNRACPNLYSTTSKKKKEKREQTSKQLESFSHSMANYKYISPDELVELLDRPDSFHKVVVVDCRDADRDSGFIANSINAPTISYTTEMYEQLAKQLFEEKKEIAVFHCAQSLIRGPKGANRFAMAQKAKGYPLPVVYVLRGGWDDFYDMYGDTRPDLIYV